MAYLWKLIREQYDNGHYRQKEGRHYGLSLNAENRPNIPNDRQHLRRRKKCKSDDNYDPLIVFHRHTIYIPYNILVIFCPALSPDLDRIGHQTLEGEEKAVDYPDQRN
ncbi:unnamed protein product [Onchocerca flexuosa]|uniref:Uncharacterized protein n=1 Tax=Onchocerca flexuosa TaxID=387005 RepID=A0A183I0R5_9BILA|nr:unnamed protein product [Onchocerca flexuosa]